MPDHELSSESRSGLDNEAALQPLHGDPRFDTVMASSRLHSAAAQKSQ
jgi:hypothetical protein